MENFEVISGTARIIGEIRRKLPSYAGPHAPVSTSEIAELLHASNCAWVVFPFPKDEDGQAIDPAFVMPPILGKNVIAVDQQATKYDRMFCVRHELAHVYANEVTEPTFLSDRFEMSSSERRADLVALADLIPGHFLARIRRAGADWMEVLQDIRVGITECYAHDWSLDRAADRARLRLRLYRERGL